MMSVYPIAPSGPFDLSRYETGCNLLKQWGFSLIKDANLEKNTFSYLNGSDENRLKLLRNAFLDTQSTVIWTARGGYGLTRLLPHLHHNPLSIQNPKMLIGFSDACALVSYLYTYHNQTSIHGPNITSLVESDTPIIQAILNILQNEKNQLVYPPLTPIFQNTSLHTIQGPLFAYNLCMLTCLAGTPFMPSFKNAILALEDINEPAYKLDRMLTYLTTLGVFENVKALVLGHFTHCDQEAQNVLQERLIQAGIPLIVHLPFGHEWPNWPLVFGGQYEIQLSAYPTLHWI